MGRFMPLHGVSRFQAPTCSLSIPRCHTESSSRENDEVAKLAARPLEALNMCRKTSKIDNRSVVRAMNQW